MRKAPRRRLTASWIPATLLLLGGALACDGNGRTVLGPAIALFCSPDATTIPSGGTAPLGITFVVTATGRPVGGRTIAFTSTAGDVAPDTAVTGADGSVRVFLTPPGTAGHVVVAAQVADGPSSERVSTSCTIQVTGAADPRVSVIVVTPPQLAGLELVVAYDAADVVLLSTTLLGGLNGTDCTSDERLSHGRVDIGMACPTLRQVGGTEVARLTFDAVAGIPQGPGDFLATCSGYDVTGTRVATACSITVTDL